MDQRQNGQQNTANETSLQCVMRMAANHQIESVLPWEQRMRTCQVPCYAPASEWNDGILRVLSMGDNAWTL